MAKNLTSFDIGNTANLRLTDEIAELFINTIRLSGRVTIAAQRCGISNTTAKDWIRRGRTEEEGPFHDLTLAYDRAKSEFLLTAAARLKQLALGGVLELPCYDKTNNLVRDEDGNMIFTERFFPPNERALEYILDRSDPQPREPEADAPPTAPEPTDAEQLAEAAKHYDLFAEVFRTMVELGYPGVQRLIEQAAIETTSPAPAEPEPATPTDPPKSDPEAF